MRDRTRLPPRLVAPIRVTAALARRAGRTALLLAAAVFVSASISAAQETGQVTGQVVEAGSGAPMAQVQIYLEDAAVGTLTRGNGRFVLLNVPTGTHQLVAERIGQQTVRREITVRAGDAVQVNLEMESEALGLDELVVTGTAGASRRRELGNSISQIRPDQLEDRPVDVTDMLEGTAPGVEVVSAGGEIGQGSRIQLRGQNSLEMTNQPLIYIDGQRMQSRGFPTRGPPDRRAGRSANVTASPLDMINPSDIERIEVIKGSAATTLYGTEASAGVIQIFTKSGETGAPVWTLETEQGTSWSRQFGVDGSQFGVEGAEYAFMKPYLRSDPFGIGGGDFGISHSQGYSASVRGGGQDLQYFISGRLQDQIGIMPQDELEKWNVRGNFTFTPADALQLQFNTGYTHRWQRNTASANNAQGLTLNAFRQERNYFGSGAYDEVVKILDLNLQNTIERFTTGGTITYSPLANLTNRLTIGYDYNQQLQRHLRPFGFELLPQGALHVDKWENRLLTFDYVGSYAFDITESVSSDFSWGGQAVSDEEHNVETYGENFPGAANPTINSAAINMGFERAQEVWTAGLFAQNVFDFEDRYFVTIGARVDGNSAFGEDFGLEFYPKVSTAWVISDESFWNESVGQLRLRTAYGQSGRAPGAFDAVRTWTSIGYDGEAAFAPRNVGNPNLGPEVSSEFEVGFEGSWIDGRLSADFTYYRQVTTDALIDVPQIPSQGFTRDQLTNVGKVRGSGLELALNASLLERRDWGWDVGLNLSTNENEILDLGPVEPTPWLQEGQPLRPEVDDFVTNPNDVADPELEEDHFYGPTHPTRVHSANTTVRLPGGVRLSARGEYRGGHYLDEQVWAIGRSVRSPLCFPFYRDPQNSVELRDDVPAIWRARCDPAHAEGYVWAADFFKLRSVSASFPVDFALPDRVDTGTLVVALNNSFLWMKEMPFMDPEMLGNDGINTDAAGFSERVPSPISLRASLRITF